MDHEPSSLRRRRAVVVNDDPGVLDLYRDILVELRYEPVAMETKAIATERITSLEPDAVILDLEVGAEARYGVSMAVQLRDNARFAHIPIVVCTAQAEALDGERRKLRDIGVPVVRKPFTVAELESVLNAPVPAGNRPIAAPE